MQENGRKEAINSIMAHRNQIAHGKGNNVNVTMSQMKDYIEKAVEVIIYIEKQCQK